MINITNLKKKTLKNLFHDNFPQFTYSSRVNACG